jgi:hypothetical protein
MNKKTTTNTDEGTDQALLPRPGTVMNLAVVGLVIHKAARDLPAWSEDDARFLALVDDIRDKGILEAIKVTPKREIVDGRHRFRAAQRLQLENVRCEVVAEDMIPEVILSTLLRRRHYTAGQRAYVLAPMVAPAFKAAQLHRMDGLNRGTVRPIRNLVPHGAENPEEFAESIGISVRYLRSAIKLYDLFNLYKSTEWKWSDSDRPMTFREYFEPQILRDVGENEDGDTERPLGLGAAVAAIGSRIRQAELEAKGKKHEGGGKKGVPRQLNLWMEGIDAWKAKWRYWDEFDEPTRCKAADYLGETCQGMPSDLLAQLNKCARNEVLRRKREEGGLH